MIIIEAQQNRRHLKPRDIIMLDKFLKNSSRLRTDKNRRRWSALTTHQAPHKPFLLLSIMDLIAWF